MLGINEKNKRRVGVIILVMKIIAENRQARFDNEILEEFEAGVKLIGLEVKSAKAGKISLKSSFAKIYGNNKLYLINANIQAWQPNNTPSDYEPTRSRELLLTGKEMKYLAGKDQEKGLSIIPLAAFIKNNLIKIKIGLVRGKKKYDKRETIKKREVGVIMDRERKQY